MLVVLSQAIRLSKGEGLDVVLGSQSPALKPEKLGLFGIIVTN